ncbi:TPA: TonB-dependent receptor [Pseudomonas aeruginosa]|nr:TonB-dependent receptor [Pseudomonas aeruginosa]HEP8786139.1 TonB-dependent receptor [Pseudomonas aeruginosa]
MSLRARSSSPPIPFRLTPLVISIGLSLAYIAAEIPSAHAQEAVAAGTERDENTEATSPVLELNTSEADTANVLEAVTVYGEREDRDERGRNDVYDQDVVNVYQGKEEIERYRGTSAADLFKGMNGVYSGDARSGGLDPNIRGIQGEGRVPLTVDGTEQATSIWQTGVGVSNRNYVDPNLISSITVEKGPNATSAVSGIGGSVQVRTLEPDDIIKPGESFGIELKMDTATNSVKPDERAFSAYGKDYRDLGITPDVFGGISPATITGGALNRKGKSGRDFDFDDNAYRLAIAKKQDHFDLLAAYSYRKRGNYYSGKRGAGKYEQNTWMEDAAEAANSAHGQAYRPSVSYIAQYYLPGQEVANTSSELESTLLKGTLRLPENQTINMSFMRNDHTFGETVPWKNEWLVQRQNELNSNGAQEQYPYSTVKQDTWNLGYSFSPENNRLIDLKAAVWMTQSDSERHQNGEDPYGVVAVGNVIPGSGDFDPIIRPRALQISDHRRIGFNLSNNFQLHKSLDLTVSGDWTKERLRQQDASEMWGLENPYNAWGSRHWGPRAGRRQQWNAGFNFDWRPTGWLQINAGARYSDYWSFDDQLAEKRAAQDEDWAVQRGFVSRNITIRELMSDEEVSALIEDKRSGYQDEVDLYTKWFPDRLAEFLEKYPDADSFAYSNEDTRLINGYFYKKEETVISIPYNGDHRGFSENNPFANGEIDATEAVDGAQGKEGSAPKYYISDANDYSYGSNPENKWEEPKKQKDHAWVPHIGLTAFISDNARIYVRYSEAVRFPSLFESSNSAHSMGASGSNSLAGVVSSPEHAYNWEIGYVHNLIGYFDSLESADFRVNYFNNRIEDYIDRDWNMNTLQFSEKKLSGIELQARADSGKYFMNIGATYRLKQKLCDKDYASFLDPVYGRVPECVDGGFPLTYARTSLQPKYSVNLDLGARFFERKLEIGTRAVYHSAAKNQSDFSAIKLITYNSTPNYWNPILVFDAYASYRVTDNLNFDLGITNLTNRYYVDPLARVVMPAPGRTVRVGMTARF